ncbi:hypothetical protein Fmac_032100 [Flemingia macrophylla]|uniref:Uncharacterized protein n=1 Tax=Flemingia macrophylla TaxID=520843 RepID=A0ABD1L3Z0_9FABA
MLRLWKWYQNCLAVHPVKTQVISSGLIWGAGDIAAQAVTNYTAKTHITMDESKENGGMEGPFAAVWHDILSLTPQDWGCELQEDGTEGPFTTVCHDILSLTPQDRGCELQEEGVNLKMACILEFDIGNIAYVDKEKEFKINWKRVSTTSLFGLGFVGPVGHYWYEGLDRFIRLRLMLKPNSVRFVATKVAVDGFLFGPLDLLVFFTYMGFSSGKSVPQIKEDVKRDFLPAFVLEGGIWPVVQVANFRFIPVRYQLLYVNFFCLLDSCFLSWVEQQQDAQWKQWLKSYLPLK